MRALLKNVYLKNYNTRFLVRLVHDLYDDYNYKRFLSRNIYDSALKKSLLFREEDLSYHKKSDPTEQTFKLKQEIDEFINLFNRKVELMLEEFTDDEKRIYNDCIINRLSDKVVKDRICKTDKTYYRIKKSCYLKVVLCFELVDGYEKNIATSTISLAG